MGILYWGAFGLGTLLALIGWIWLIVIAFKVGGPIWGIINIFVQPLSGIVFCIMNKTGWAALALMIVGLVIQLGGLVPMIVTNMDKFAQ